MKRSDFYIGLEFLGSAGLRWRCTDVGTRTILAICLDEHDTPYWHMGPPHITEEVVFDEKEIRRCFLSTEEAIAEAVLERESGTYPGYPAEFVKRMMEAQRSQRYPHEGVLRFDRRRSDGEILHPYAGRKEAEAWVVEVYLPFRDAYESWAEEDFVALPRATEQDIRRRADESKRTGAVGPAST